MSLAMYAAPFDNDILEVNNSNQQNDNSIAKKKQSSNKTQKRYPSLQNNYSEKVNSVLQTIHNLPEQEENELGDFKPYFNPPPKPISAGVEQTKMKEPSPTTNINTASVSSNFNSNLIGESVTNAYANPNSTDDYYKRFIPDYQKMYNSIPQTVPINNSNSNSSLYSSSYSSPYSHQGSETNQNKVLLDKLNYMINLLEQDQDEKTQTVMEEVILYCFLGVFIIFICDSFAKVGKYVR
jgi:hypothetical protein